MQREVVFSYAVDFSVVCSVFVLSGYNHLVATQKCKSHTVWNVDVLRGSWECQSVVIIEAQWWVHGGSLSYSNCMFENFHIKN